MDPVGLELLELQLRILAPRLRRFGLAGGLALVLRIPHIGRRYKNSDNHHQN